MSEKVYEVIEWDEKSLNIPDRLRFKSTADMKEAHNDIMNDKDIVIKTKVKGKVSVSHIPYTLLKQPLYEGRLIFEAEED